MMKSAVTRTLRFGATLICAALLLLLSAPAEAKCPENNGCALSYSCGSCYTPDCDTDCGTDCDPNCISPRSRDTYDCPAVCRPFSRQLFCENGISLLQSLWELINGGYSRGLSGEPETETESPLLQKELELINEQREAAGLSPLLPDEQLSQAAQLRAQEILTLFSHTRPNGESCFTVLGKELSYTTAGENIALGQTSAEQVMEDWMNSPGHRANILGKDFRKAGLALLPAENGGYAWVQIFTD